MASKRPTVQEPDPARLQTGLAVPVAGLVGYNAGAVVSRTIVQNQAGNITLFAFDVGQGLSEHTTPFDAFVHVLEGRARVLIGGKPIDAGAGEVLLMPALVPHAVQAPQRFKMLLVMMRGAT
ncbi:MAG: cupin domain-containing protein [Deltaproteobacteria bacterium]|nr:cupin domain-containing protein [Deltaproteobacteria bacterium]